MASVCKNCGDINNYNFALNIGLCDPCIGAKLDKLESDQKMLLEACKIAWDELFDWNKGHENSEAMILLDAAITESEKTPD